MVHYNPPHSWVVFHALYTANKHGFLFIAHMGFSGSPPATFKFETAGIDSTLSPQERTAKANTYCHGNLRYPPQGHPPQEIRP